MRNMVGIVKESAIGYEGNWENFIGLFTITE